MEPGFYTMFNFHSGGVALLNAPEGVSASFLNRRFFLGTPVYNSHSHFNLPLELRSPAGTCVGRGSQSSQRRRREPVETWGKPPRLV